MSLLKIKKTSAWKFVTSATGGASIGYFSASGGKIALMDPSRDDPNHPSWIHYAGAGGGVSVGLKKLPKIGRLLDTRGLSEKGAGNLAPANFWNHGIVYVMNGCHSDDLSLSDFKGPCCFVDIGAGLIAGYAGFALLMNVNPVALAALPQPVTGTMLFEVMADPTAMLLTRGWNVGPQASAGISLSEGWVW